jgi:hypothetical protein
MNNELVIIGFADALSAPEVAFSLLDAGFRVAAFMRRNSRPPALRRCRDIEIIEVSAPEDDPQQAVSDLNSFYKSSGAAAVMPLNDKALWMCDQLAADRAIKVAGPTADRAAFSLDKRMQIHAASAAGFNVPKTIVLQSVADCDHVTVFPVVVKPALAVAEAGKSLLKKERLHFCANRDEFDKALSSWNQAQPLLAQAVLQGIGEGLFGFAAENDIYCWSAHRRVRMMNPKGSGSSACRAVPVSNHPVKQAEDMLRGAGWRGPFMIELLRDEAGKLWFVEMNGRPWGSMALALQMGFDYPVWAVQQVLNPAFTPPPPAMRTFVTCRHLGRELIHILQVVRGPSSAAIPNWPSIPQTLFNVLRISKDDRWYNWRSYNKTLFVMDTYNTLMNETVRKWLKK